MKLVIGKELVSGAVWVFLEHVKQDFDVPITEGRTTSLALSEDNIVQGPIAVCRHLSRKNGSLYGENILEKAEIDHWLEFCNSRLRCNSTIIEALEYLEGVLAPNTYLVGHSVTLADVVLWSTLRDNAQFLTLIADGSVSLNIGRYYQFLATKQEFGKNEPKFSSVAATSEVKQTVARKERKEEGKFIELAGAEMGKVVVRFPPEASGYLHIGHAKAALLNQHYQQSFKGKLIMRFDDTNPAKEDEHFEKVILEDVAMLGLKPNIFTHTSDSFDIIQNYCEKMLKEGKAYCDNTPSEQMKKEREERINSIHRNNSVEKNLEMWGEMKKGSEVGTKCCVRAKLAMQSDNGCLRDPAMYRCKPEPHVRTGTKYKVYPTYDFACPIVDSIEGVTHALRTTEYHDRDDQYNWFIDELGLRRPHVWEYSRLNLQNTVMSKRKLTWFVNEGIVDSWDDPRFPTVRGVLRRGMTVEGLKEFIISQGSSRSIVMMEWDKIWAVNKKVIDPVAPRHTALEQSNVVEVRVLGAKEECSDVPKHPKNSDIGLKKVWYSEVVLIEGDDASVLSVGENVTFINWGNLIIKEINRGKDGRITGIEACLNLDNKDYKKTQKITWLAITKAAPLTPVRCIIYDHIITKGILGKEEDFKDYVNRDSKLEKNMIGDPEISRLRKGDTIQLQRRGYFICDSEYEPASRHSGRESPCILINIPDGHTKEMPKAGSKHKQQSSKKDPTQKDAKSCKTQTVEIETPANATEINQQIVDQGNQVRNLKSQKAPKNEVDAAVKALLALKKAYKSATGNEWKPGALTAVAPPARKAADEDGNAINSKIVEQGNIVRDLKSKKADKNEVDAAVKALLALKKAYKSATGNEWKPGALTAVAPPARKAADEDGNAINSKIVEQGNIVRDLKSKKADKNEVDAAVKALLALKKTYKSATGNEWKPGALTTVAPPARKAADEDGNAINSKIVAQGNIVRDLKSKKADKNEIGKAVKVLLTLKENYHAATGNSWKPGCCPSAVSSAPAGKDASDDANSLSAQIVQQGDKVRNMKSQNVTKTAIETEVKLLLSLKAKYKDVSGTVWTPPQIKESTSEKKPNMASKADELKSKIDAQGQRVRDLKQAGAPKDDVSAEVAVLLALKKEYTDLTGEDLPGGAKKEKKPTGEKKPGSGKKEKKTKEPNPTKKENTSAVTAREVKKVTRLGIESKKEDNLAEWYSQAIVKAEMIEYYDVSGCYVLRPWAFGIWERISNWFDAKIKDIGFENCYFPLFVSGAALEREKDHIEDFAPEVAWVTRSGNSELAEPIAIRPTSETVMYPSYAKWVQSHRDLPIKLNQWCSVVRWEFKHPQPFLRTREFLWQEGHSAYATYEEAEKEVYHIIDLYEHIYEKLLAIPVVKGRKTQKERFAGGDFTTTVEAYISASGRGIQAATSHHLGQNFSKMFDISFEDPETHEKRFAYQNSWAITTRSIGVLVMVHGDNKGLVLPPNIAQLQVVLVPCGITAQLGEAERSELTKHCEGLSETLKKDGVRIRADLRDNYSPGWKFNHWELKGVPLRIEVGPRDMKQNQVVAVRRDTGDKITLPTDDIASSIAKLLEKIQDEMFLKQKNALDENIIITGLFDQFCSALDKKNLILSPYCGDVPCEDSIKKLSARDAVVEEGAPAMGAKGLCIPFNQPADISPTDKCICPGCPNKPVSYCLFGRSY